jgi:hypothetical protein
MVACLSNCSQKSDSIIHVVLIPHDPEGRAFSYIDGGTRAVHHGIPFLTCSSHYKIHSNDFLPT